MNIQSTERHVYISLFCFDKLNTKQGNKNGFNEKSHHPQHILQ